MEQPFNLFLQGSVFTPTVVYVTHVPKFKKFSPPTLLQSLLLLHEMICLDVVIWFFSPWLFPGCQIAYCQSRNHSLKFITLVGIY